jgi:thiol-disulfide isomerase/thioredoxin
LNIFDAYSGHMKRLVFFFVFIAPFFAFTQSTKPAEKPGYEIRVNFKPFKDQWIYLGYYGGSPKTLPIIDSVMVNEKSDGVFKGTKKLGSGVYLIGYPNKLGFFEFLVGKDQHFSIMADSTDLKNIKFINSPDNDLFVGYQHFMGENGKKIDSAKQLISSVNEAGKKEIDGFITKKNKDIRDYRLNIINKYPETTLAFLLKLLEEPEIPTAEKHPGGKYDSAFAYRYYKLHFWEGINFYDDRLVRTPIFDAKLDKYFDQVVVPHPDSVIKEMDYMLGFASANEETQKFLLLKFVNRYLNQKYMWEDAVFVHLYEKYFSQKTYPWITEKGVKMIQDRAYSLMANILGNAAADIDLPDSTGKHVTLYSLTSPYTVVVIWDPTCGHCKEVVPKVDSMLEEKWKPQGVKVYGLAKETDGTKKDWLDFIHDHHLADWVNVYYSKADDKARIDAGIPGYSQLYDVLSFPTLYLLDKDKRIIAKKLTYDQINEVLQQKISTATNKQKGP